MPPDLNELCIEFILLNDENKSARQHVYKSSKDFNKNYIIWTLKISLMISITNTVILSHHICST